MPLVAQTMKSQQMRTIYSESYLGIEAVRGIRARNKLAIAEPGKFVQDTRKEFGENGVSNMSEEDLTRDISAVSCDNDFLMARNLLRD